MVVKLVNRARTDGVLFLVDFPHWRSCPTIGTPFCFCTHRCLGQVSPKLIGMHVPTPSPVSSFSLARTSTKDDCVGWEPNDGACSSFGRFVAGKVLSSEFGLHTRPS